MAFEGPKHIRNMEKRLKMVQNYNEQKIGQYRWYGEHINKPDNFLNEGSNAVIKQYDAMVIGDLNVRTMERYHRSLKGMAGVSWHKLGQRLNAEADRHCEGITMEPRTRVPSSEMCSGCGNIKHDQEPVTLGFCGVCQYNQMPAPDPRSSGDSAGGELS